jgi:kumamolisin
MALLAAALALGAFRAQPAALAASSGVILHWRSPSAPSGGGTGMLRTNVQERLGQLHAHYLGPRSGDAPMTITVPLPFRDMAGLDELTRRLYAVGDPLYHKFLTPKQFNERFGATQADHDEVATFLSSHGLTVSTKVPGRNLVVASGTTAQVERALGVTINNYRLLDGRVAHANAGEPNIPMDVAGKIIGVIGLDDLSRPRPTLSRPNPLDTRIVPTNIGSGPGNGLTPSDIKTAYNITNPALTGAGQTVALLEFDTYLQSDIQKYTDTFNLGDANLENVPVAGFGAPPGPDTIEVVLDIDMVVALAPKTHILVYEAENGTVPFSVIFHQMATENRASIISVSWGSPEDLVPQSELTAENNFLTQLASQGVSTYVSSGDTGAFIDRTNPTTPVVSEPAAQPNVIAVGGTTLFVTGAGGTYTNETTWNELKNGNGAGGGGISTVWSKPAYQTGFGASSMREVPDVSLNADPLAGYSEYFTPPGAPTAAWAVVGGTSAAAPLWAGFTSLVAEKLASLGGDKLGFANMSIYPIASDPVKYANDFHDIKDGSNNGFPSYKATPGFDDATGWGSFVGDALLSDMAPPVGGTPGSLTGTVFDQNNAPLGGATINVYRSGISTVFATTTSSTDTKDPCVLGTYSLKLPSGAAFTVTADAPGYAGQIVNNVTVPANDTVNLNFTLAPGHQLTDGIQMLSAPVDFTQIGDFSSIVTMTPDDTVARPPLIVWQADVNEYIESPLFPADTLRLGQGYWVKMPSTAYLHRQGLPAPTGQAFRFTLEKGWNLIGDPFDADVPISAIMADKLIPDVPDAPMLLSDPSQTLVVPVFWGFDGAKFAEKKYPYVQNDLTKSLSPWQGYWVFAPSPAVLVIPPPGGIPPPPPPPLPG